ncbi:hypothetical protein Scep_018383 [Stephania cephalantha]|uniref:Uncharacterized protein n=1 Tax=Stephania cephalantha TaxID=152367 RepID=A0AAP0IRY6_9MAGN
MNGVRGANGTATAVSVRTNGAACEQIQWWRRSYPSGGNGEHIFACGSGGTKAQRSTWQTESVAASGGGSANDGERFEWRQSAID